MIIQLFGGAHLSSKRSRKMAQTMIAELFVGTCMIEITGLFGGTYMNEAHIVMAHMNGSWHI